ncbi:extracellular matrix protein 2 isoform X3 [Phyllopteryx taeniolatus]|uniref:extracellular matrix protein 2 isoform X3 n=1 Tax=Phyllopteryx taeniolatus TaxID=161469 RepID=UPI002AD57DBB|nr:extracellular matrix protein 2 isoform X3 [Phyllopteryx taeniolatus]
MRRPTKKKRSQEATPPEKTQDVSCFGSKPPFWQGNSQGMRTGPLLAAVWLLLVFTVTPGQNGRDTRRTKRKRDGHEPESVYEGNPESQDLTLASLQIPAFAGGTRVCVKRGSARVCVKGSLQFQDLTLTRKQPLPPDKRVTLLCTVMAVACFAGFGDKGQARVRSGHAKPLRSRQVPHSPRVPAEPVRGNAVLLESYRDGPERHSSYNVLPDPDLSLELSGDSPAPRNHDNHDSIASTPQLTHEEIQRILWREEEERLEEDEQLRKREEAKKRKRKERKEQEEKQRRIAEEARRRREEEEEERRKTEEEESRRKEEKEAREREEKLREEILREQEEEEVWLRGDVFQMLPKEEEEPEEPDLLPAPIPRPPAAAEDELKEEEDEEEEEEKEVAVKAGGLPPGCDISDVTLTCDNAKLTYFPPLLMPQLKSLSLEGNNISSIPAEAFNGIPNLEWINLKKNKLTSAGIAQRAFQSLKMLKRLYLDGNLLEVAPANLPPSLQELKINENRLQRIQGNTFQGLSSLVILELEANLLSEANMDPEAFASLAQLSYLRLGQNHFRSVPQGLPPLLLELYLENNLIEEIPAGVFNNSQNLNVLSLRHNRLEETRIAPLAWIHHRSLESVDLSYNKLYLVPSYLPTSLVHLVLVGNHIERIPGFVFAHMDPGLEYLYLSYNKLDGEAIEPESFFGSYHSMVELCLDHNQLLSVPSGINEMTNLHFLRLNNNNIRSIPDEGICDPECNGDSTLVAVRLENNLIDPLKVSPSAFSCVRSSSSVVLKPQKIK